MQTVIESLREIIGTPDFYIEGSNYSSTWDYGAMIEYAGALILILVVVSSVFKIIKGWICKK